MRVYVAHPTSIDYENEIYKPLRNDSFCLEHELILPHENSVSISNLREDYKNYDIAIAECSKPSIGVGIELGWLYDEKKPIYCFCREEIEPSSALKAVAKKIIKYKDGQDFVNKVKEIIEESKG